MDPNNPNGEGAAENEELEVEQVEEVTSEFYGMSDADFMTQPTPKFEEQEPTATPAAEVPAKTEAAPVVSDPVPAAKEKPAAEVPAKETPAKEEPNPLADADNKQQPPAAAQVPEKKDPVVDPAAKPDAAKPELNADGTPKVPAAAAEKPAAAVEGAYKAPETIEEYKAVYDMLMGPVKANGKEIQVRNPEEALGLMRMGANYTKKMQALQPALRIVRMLENNKLLDETRLAYLIDLDKGDPGAIQKLLADSKFDPVGVDAEKAAQYVPGDHQVSESEMALSSALDDVESTASGKELIQEIATQWDPASKKALFQDPNLLRTLGEQRELGLYTRITEEVERQTALGKLQGVPFLQAYQAVGDWLNSQGLLAAPKAKVDLEPPVQVPAATRVETPAPAASNSEKAKAASPTRHTPAAADGDDNFLGESDEAFLKRMNGRL